MRLEDWSVVYTDDIYTAPELRIPRMRGKVYGNPKFEDGEYIVTSALKSMRNKKTIITESGSHYILGKPDPEYEKIYPEPLKKLYASYKLSKMVRI